MHVVHLSTVHSSSDPRIRLKQLASVVEGGYRATLITGDPTGCTDPQSDGVELIYISPGAKTRWIRMLFTSPRAVWRAAKLEADVYHVHDPELLLYLFLLHFKGKPVVYDIHEDYISSVAQKKYIPAPIRRLLAIFVGMAEHALSVGCQRIIAERYYGRRFPDALPILNYPRGELLSIGSCFDSKSNRLIYTGTVTEDRGAVVMADMLSHNKNWSIYMLGMCLPSVAARIREAAGDALCRIHLPYVGQYVPFALIRQAYCEKGWLAGVALFPDTPHYREKELTKFYEYMAVGLPIIASNFPAWVELIEGNGVGICIDPLCPDAFSTALNWLQSNPIEAQLMGERGRELVQGKFSWQSEGHRLLQFYGSLAQE